METTTVRYRVEYLSEDHTGWIPCGNVLDNYTTSGTRELIDPVGGFDSLYVARLYRDLHEEAFPDVPTGIKETTTITTVKQYTETIE